MENGQYFQEKFLYEKNSEDNMSRKILSGPSSCISGLVLKAKLNLGIGSLILMKAQLDEVRDKLKLYVSPNWELINKYRNGSEDYKNFIREFFKILFPPPYIITEDQDYHERDYWLFTHFDNIPFIIPKWKIFTKIFCNPKMHIDIDEKFIVITTKVRLFKQSNYNKIKPIIQDVIKELSNKYKIVVMGEKVVEMNAEYLQLQKKDQIFSIYNDIIECVPKNRIIDTTYDGLGITSPILSRLKEDCTIMKNAVRTICIGTGGNFILALSCGSPFILRQPNIKEPFTEITFKNDNDYVMSNIERFIQVGKRL